MRLANQARAMIGLGLALALVVGVGATVADPVTLPQPAAPVVEADALVVSVGAAVADPVTLMQAAVAAAVETDGCAEGAACSLWACPPPGNQCCPWLDCIDGWCWE